MNEAKNKPTQEIEEITMYLDNKLERPFILVVLKPNVYAVPPINVSGNAPIDITLRLLKDAVKMLENNPEIKAIKK